MRGPRCYENWKAASAGVPARGSSEATLFTDAYFTGSFRDGLGPYEFLNLVNLRPSSSRARPGIVLRIVDHSLPDTPLPSMDDTNVEAYHGAGLDEELAALGSLVLGRRLRSSGVTRWFDVDGDPKGHPYSSSSRAEPVLLSDFRTRVIPSATQEAALGALSRLATLPQLSALAASALVQAARQYQQALWLAETLPEVAWLQMVSALERAATFDYSSRASTPIADLTAANPGLVDALRDACGATAVSLVAKSFSGLTAPTKKFVHFGLRYLPPPPPERPPWPRAEWSRGAMRRSLSRIYHWRSRALHDGIPFPWPLCQPPDSHGHNVPPEKPMGEAISASGGTWTKDDVPMHLHIFEYIVRSCLLSWWDALVALAPGAPSVTPAASRHDGDAGLPDRASGSGGTLEH